MTVLIFNKKGFPKYIPLRRGKYLHDYDVAENLMPQHLVRKIRKNIMREAMNHPNRRAIDLTIPPGIDKYEVDNRNLEIVNMSIKLYRAVMEEINIKGVCKGNLENYR